MTVLDSHHLVTGQLILHTISDPVEATKNVVDVVLRDLVVLRRELLADEALQGMFMNVASEKGLLAQSNQG